MASRHATALLPMLTHEAADTALRTQRARSGLTAMLYSSTGVWVSQVTRLPKLVTPRFVLEIWTLRYVNVTPKIK